MMTGYILSILGIVVAGVFIDIVVPASSLNKYIKGIYAIFVVAVILNPIIKLLNKTHNLTINYTEYSVNDSLLNYIFTMRARSLEKNIEQYLSDEGFENVGIVLNFSIENDELIYSSCEINLKNMVISSDKQHINKYEFIKKVVVENTSLTHEEIVFNE